MVQKSKTVARDFSSNAAAMSRSKTSGSRLESWTVRCTAGRSWRSLASVGSKRGRDSDSRISRAARESISISTAWAAAGGASNGARETAAGAGVLPEEALEQAVATARSRRRKDRLIPGSPPPRLRRPRRTRAGRPVPARPGWQPASGRSRRPRSGRPGSGRRGCRGPSPRR